MSELRNFINVTSDPHTLHRSYVSYTLVLLLASQLAMIRSGEASNVSSLATHISKQSIAFTTGPPCFSDRAGC
jgi:hypothetical protein